MKTNESEDNKQADVVDESPAAEDVLYPDKEVEDKKPDEVVEEKEAVVEEKVEESQSESDELKLVAPEGSGLSDEDVNGVKEFAKANKLSQESSQKLLDEKAGFASKIAEKSKADFKEKTDGWLKEVKQIKTFDEDLKTSQDVLDKWFDPDFKKMLNETGLGNHPGMFKGLAKLGKAMNPKPFVAAPKNAAAPKLQDHELFYGPDEKSS